jgi:hypothetical protein
MGQYNKQFEGTKHSASIYTYYILHIPHAFYLPELAGGDDKKIQRNYSREERVQVYVTSVPRKSIAFGFTIKCMP